MAALTVQQVLQKFGLGSLYNAADPLMQVYDSIASSYVTRTTPVGFKEVCIAMMIARQYLYFKNTPGDCGQATGVASGTAIAGRALQTAGSALPVIGAPATFFGQILGIFGQHHAQAVATEQSTICDVTAKTTQAFVQLDQYVASGQIGLADALKGIEQIRAAAAGMLQGILKDCNSACVATRCISAVCDLRKQIYSGAANQPPSQVPISSLPAPIQKIFGLPQPPQSGSPMATTQPTTVQMSGLQQAGAGLSSTNTLVIAAVAGAAVIAAA